VTPVRNARVLVIGWLLQVKMLSRSSFNSILAIVYPLFFATVAFRETATLNNIAFGTLLVFCGVNVSLSNLPSWMSTIAQGLPLTHGIEAGRKLADGQSLSHVGGLVLAELGIGAVYAAVGYGFIRLLQHESRIHATLERA
jgi:ABC-2 type transporter